MEFYKQNSELIRFKMKQMFPAIQKYLQEHGELATMQWLYDQVEANIAREPAMKNLTCKKGCSLCCHDIIYLQPFEVKYLKEKLKERGIVGNLRVRDIQNSKPKEELTFNEKQCRFLSQEGECTIYDIRPMVCRLHNSVSPAILCDRSKGPSTHQQLHVISNEAIQFALMVLSNLKSDKDLIPIHEI